MSQKYLNETGLSYFWSKVKAALNMKQDVGTYASSPLSNGNAVKANSILFGTVDGTSTATVFTATVAGLTELYDGVSIMLKNGVATSATGFTININNLGAKPVYSNLSAASQDSTIFNINYTMLFVYDSSRVDGGCWICYRGYDSNTNTVGYQVRGNSATLPASFAGRRYRLWFTSADGTKFVPANKSTATNNTTARTLNTDPIDPFGRIIYNSTNDTATAGEKLPVAACWTQLTLDLRYSITGKTLVAYGPVYLKCTPQSNGSAIMNDVVTSLPASNDGKIYIFLGIAYSTSSMELFQEHPVYYHDGTGIRIWAGASSVIPSASSSNPIMDGTASPGSSNDYARGDHVHPSDTSKQATLVSGTNIKTINGSSILGSGDLTVGSNPTAMTQAEVLTAVQTGWGSVISGDNTPY